MKHKIIIINAHLPFYLLTPSAQEQISKCSGAKPSGVLWSSSPPHNGICVVEFVMVRAPSQNVIPTPMCGAEEHWSTASTKLSQVHKACTLRICWEGMVGSNHTQLIFWTCYSNLPMRQGKYSWYE